MKYFEFTSPYYALIKGESQEEVRETFNKNVAEGEEDLQFKEISRDLALIKLSRAPGEFQEVVAEEYIVEDFNDEENKVLLIDGGLL